MSDIVYSHNVIIKSEDTTLTSSQVNDQYEFVGWSGNIVRINWHYGDE